MPKNSIARVAIIINADGRTIADSATFIRSHINALSAEFDVVTLVGNPGSRRLLDSGADLQSQTIVGKGFRKLFRILTGQSVIEQDNRRLARMFKSHRVDAVFCEYGMSGAGVLPCCKTLGLPLIVHFHGYDVYRHDLVKQYESQYQELFDYASAIIAVSQDMRSTLAVRYGNEHKIIHNCCGVYTAEIRKLSENRQRKKQFVSLGRLTPKKDPVGVIECFAKAAEKIPDYRLAVVGDGELKEECERRVIENNIDDRVDFYGALEHRAALAVVVESSIFVMNSVTAESGDKEGTPVSLMEAMAAGLTPLGTKHGGIMDIIEDSKSGFLYEEHDYEALSRLMVDVASQENRTEIEENARRYAIQNLDETNKTDKIISIIRAAVESRTGFHK